MPLVLLVPVDLLVRKVRLDQQAQQDQLDLLEHLDSPDLLEQQVQQESLVSLEDLDLQVPLEQPVRMAHRELVEAMEPQERRDQMVLLERQERVVRKVVPEPLVQAEDWEMPVNQEDLEQQVLLEA